MRLMCMCMCICITVPIMPRNRVESINFSSHEWGMKWRHHLFDVSLSSSTTIQLLFRIKRT